MKIIFGIGNPGKKYEFTRHNIGFLVLDKLAKRHNMVFKPSKSDYYIAGPNIDKDTRPNFLLVKPTTYVNLSGNAALDLFEKYQITPRDFLVVTDDLNLPNGKIRVRVSGGDGGHNGISNIIYQLETDQFPRIRFGIGNKFKQGQMKDFVLSRITDDEFKELNNSFEFCTELIEAFIEDGTKKMLDCFSKNSQSINKNLNNNSES